jgi:hypothetical protein
MIRGFVFVFRRLPTSCSSRLADLMIDQTTDSIVVLAYYARAALLFCLSTTLELPLKCHHVMCLSSPTRSTRICPWYHHGSKGQAGLLDVGCWMLDQVLFQIMIGSDSTDVRPSLRVLLVLFAKRASFPSLRFRDRIEMDGEAFSATRFLITSVVSHRCDDAILENVLMVDSAVDVLDFVVGKIFP